MTPFQYSNKLKSVGYSNILLFFVIICLIMLAFKLSRSIDLAREELLIRIEPDLRSGTVRKAWEVPNPFVYSFALTLIQKINNWHENGSKEYSRNIMRYQNYITPRCREFLNSDFKRKKSSGQLLNRSRVIMEVSGLGFNDENNVRLTGRGTWNVDLSLNMREFIDNKLVKQRDVFWPVRVVEFNVDSEKNRQGLALDCFYKQPEIIKDYRN